jgi:hypothetical protein
MAEENLHEDALLSVYNKYAPKLEACGYSPPLPIGPGTKLPQAYVPSERRYETISGWTHPAFRPRTTPQPGAGIGIRCGKQPNGRYLIGLDLDREDIALKAIDSFPGLAVTKAGQRGFTAFFQSPRPVESHDFRIGEELVLQVLSDGRQSVLPPTTHPTTKQPYTWTCEGTLYDIPCENLPEWPEDGLEQIEAMLRPLGYESQPEKPKGNGYSNGDDSGDKGPCRELNDAAMKNMSMWVPYLGLENCKRQRGRPVYYRSIASYREGAEREDSLSFSANKGITDFGTGESFTPINIVMRCLKLDLAGAFEWLKERITPKGPEVDINFDALLNKDNARTEEAKAGDPPKNDAKHKKYKFQLVDFDDLRPGMELPYLVENMIPLKGLAMIWGKPKSLKSFVMLDMMLHVAKGWEYYGRAVKQGHVVYCAFEGGHGYDKRVEALRLEYDLDGKTPFQVMKGAANLINDHKLLISEIKDQIKEKWGDAVPVVFVLDTLNKSLHGSESKDVDMAAYMRAAEAIRDAFDCVVIIVHHCGWDETRPRGHSSQIGTIDAQLSAVREGDVVTVTVEDMRDGPEGNRILGRKKEIPVGADINGKPLTSLVIEHLDDDQATSAKPALKKTKWPASLKVFRTALIEATLSFGFDHKIIDGPVVKAVDIEHVNEVFSKIYVVKGKEDSTPEQIKKSRALAFSRALDKAQRLDLIAARVRGNQQIVWTVSPFEGDCYPIYA